MPAATLSKTKSKPRSRATSAPRSRSASTRSPGAAVTQSVNTGPSATVIADAPVTENVAASAATVTLNPPTVVATPATPATPAPSTYEDNDLVSVGYGVGKVAPNHRSWIDNTQFIGGIARNVRYDVAKAWKKLPFGKAVHILPADATDADFLRAAGVQPMDVTRLITMLEATDPALLARTLGPERARKFAAMLLSLAGAA